MTNNEKKIIMAKLIVNEFPNFAKEWHYSLRAGQKSPATCYDYACKIKQFLLSINSDISKVALEDITYSNVAEYFISLQTKTLPNGETIETSGSFQTTNWYVINSFITFLYKRNYIRENYMELIDKSNKNDLDRINQNRVLLTQDDFRKILNTVRNNDDIHYGKYRKIFAARDLAIILLFMTTGMRKTALSNINISDIDFENRILKVVDKGNKYHYYNLTNDVYNSINEWLLNRDEIECFDNKALFISKYGVRLKDTSIYDMIEKYTEVALEKALSPHKLRAGFCSILYEQTGDIEFVRRAVGHSNVATTQRYIVTKGNEKAKASAIINNLIT